MRKKVNLEYYVLNEDFNTHKIEPYNILGGTWISEYVYKNKKKFKSHDELKELLRIEFMSKFWSRAEYEILIGGLFVKYPDEFEKIDIWEQIKPNLDLITSYIEDKMEIEYK